MCPNQNHHRPVEKADSDETVLALVSPVVHYGQRITGEHFAGTGHVQSSGLTSSRPLGRVEFDPQDLLLLR